MAVWTGTLSDVGLGHLAGLNPEIQFHLNGPQMAGSTVYSTRPESTSPSPGGAFSVDLANTSIMYGDAYYTMHVIWNEPGAGASAGYAPVDVHIQTPIRTNGSGGNLGDVIGAVSNLSYVWLSLSAPSRPLPWMFWWKTDPGDPNNLNNKNTGEIRRWENI